MEDKIELLDDTQPLTGFNRKAIEHEVRVLRLKVNELIEVVNDLLEPPYTDDLDEDDEDEEEEDDVSLNLSDIRIPKKQKR